MTTNLARTAFERSALNTIHVHPLDSDIKSKLLCTPTERAAGSERRRRPRQGAGRPRPMAARSFPAPPPPSDYRPGGARRRRRRRPPTASRLKGPRKQKSLLLKRGLAKSFAYKLLKRGLANLMSPTSTSGVAPPLYVFKGQL
ncbi:hypothetical protein EVAR_2530_1 [Eumeta japonica]|uniref:Uncharacterized protein n=1 Tax=Eumeta variegata TaxID=151549 RepID=A0A4C1SRI1_EUMVA|nr:hypothetical protein EVAR_2530_1 [Eumeta japonica]